MNQDPLEQLRYPIGRFQPKDNYSPLELAEFIRTIKKFPERLTESVKDMGDKQLDTPYREGGWTVRQVVHHLADSHTNSYMRLKLAITENHPTIKPYDEKLLAELDEAKHAPVEVSLLLIDALHGRWILFLESFKETDWSRTFHHPGNGKTWRLDTTLHLYAWHCNHHLAHITSLAERMGWKPAHEMKHA